MLFNEGMAAAQRVTFRIFGHSYLIALPPPPRVPAEAVVEETREEADAPRAAKPVRYESGVFVKTERE